MGNINFYRPLNPQCLVVKLMRNIIIVWSLSQYQHPISEKSIFFKSFFNNQKSASDFSFSFSRALIQRVNQFSQPTYALCCWQINFLTSTYLIHSEFHFVTQKPLFKYNAFLNASCLQKVSMLKLAICKLKQNA